jgi:arylformamidase
MKIHDISLPLSAGTVPWPGDKPFRLTPSMTIDAGNSVNLSSFSTSSHNGTHADAPFHYNSRGATMERLPLEVFVGPALVAEIVSDQEIPVSALASLDLADVPRLLLRTAPGRDRARFPERIATLSVEAVEWLAGRGVKLIGVDVPSVDVIDSKTLPIHHALDRAGVLILENLQLDGVQAGRYELIALPLKIAGGDGSPVRAILVERDR